MKSRLGLPNSQFSFVLLFIGCIMLPASWTPALQLTILSWLAIDDFQACTNETTDPE